MVSGEISSIYKKNGKVRKVHNLILLPGLESAEALSHRLEAIGNLHSDGRPILGLDSRDLLEITLDVCPEAIFIPAHIWTPHFSLSAPIPASTRSRNASGT
jgi:PHP family Zn ribbon phosphoesterase